MLVLAIRQALTQRINKDKTKTGIGKKNEIEVNMIFKENIYVAYILVRVSVGENIFIDVRIDIIVYDCV